MTVERGKQLMGRIVKIGDQLLFETNVASAANDINKLNYLNQEMIVLKKMTDVIACVTLTNLLNNDEED